MASQEKSPVLSPKEQAVQSKLQDLYKTKTQYRVLRGVSHTSRNVDRTPANCVDLSKFNSVLGFSSSQTKDGLPETITVECNVTMDTLVAACLPRGVIPPVVMECPKISVGGGFCGHSGESSSFRYGLFSDNVRSIKGFYPDGRAFELSSLRKEDHETFYTISNTYGTIAIVTSLELTLRKAEPYVKLSYRRIGAVEEGVQMFDEAYKDDSIDYIEGTLFAKNKGIIATGTLASASEVSNLPKQTFMNAADPWYYIHLSRKLESSNLAPDAVPLTDYLFRYDRGGFWMGKNGFEYFGFPFNDWTRWLLNPVMKTHVCLKAFQQAKLNHQFFIQDMGVPPFQAGAFLNWIDANWGRYPILLWPLWLSKESLLLRKPGKENEGKVVNFGVYGDGPVSGEDIREFGMRTEDTLTELGGFKGGYALDYGRDGYYREEFDEERFKRIRVRANADHLPTPFEKFKISSRTEAPILWPFAGLYGVGYVIFEKVGRWWWQ